MEKNSSAMKNYRRYSGPMLIRSESLESKFGYKTSNFSSSSSSLMTSAASSSSSSVVNMYSIDRSAVKAAKKKTCMCSPTTHPGSFRCSVHKRVDSNGDGVGRERSSTSPYRSNRLSARRSAMTNSLVRIGTVEGDLMKRALAALIRPSSHQQRRRSGFQPRPTRLSVMFAARDSR
ncbi:hypothetical protein QQ045_026564 [Rhodiola kirilowii]